MATCVQDDPRWHRILARDPDADGRFWYSVTSTGVYCRPSCPARTAHPRFVHIHDTLDQARATGFRPCGRCHPESLSLHQQNLALAERACALIQASPYELPLGALATLLGTYPGRWKSLLARLASAGGVARRCVACHAASSRLACTYHASP